MCARWELRSDAEDRVDELALRYRIALSDLADLTFADCMHRLVAFDRSACTLHRVESETRRDPRKVKIFEGAETMGDILTRRTAAG